MNRAAALLLLLAACTAAAPPVSDWERKNAERLALTPEDRPALPPYPKKNDLVEIYVSATADFKYLVDASSLNVAPKQREVRYVLVARSPSGVENVSYEVIRCPDQYRVLAVGQRDGRWGGQPGDWREITKGTSLSWQYALSRNYFCPHRDPIRSKDEGVYALEHGVHPDVEVQRSMGGGGGY
jgi:CNP1-like family protein